MQICSMIYNMFREFILVRQFISVSMVGFAYLLPQGILCGYGYFLLIWSWYMWLHRNALGSNYGLPDVSSSLTFTDIYMCMFSLGGVVEDFGVTDCWFCVVLWPTYRPIANQYMFYADLVTLAISWHRVIYKLGGITCVGWHSLNTSGC